MGLWRPQTSTQQTTLTLSRGDNPTYEYVLDRQEKLIFPDFSPGVLEFRNASDQIIATWGGEVADGVLSFADVFVSDADPIPRGTTFTLTIEDVDGRPRQRRWGMVVRNEPRYPEFPSNNDDFDSVQYRYSFGTPGFVVDPAWRIMNGHPRVYDNSARDLPNGVAAGSLLGGDLTFFDNVAMLYYAPLNGDAVRLTYNTVRPVDNANGELWVVICSDYSMTNWAGFRHRQVWGIGAWDNDTIEVVTGTGPVTFVTRVSDQYDTLDNQNYTAEYDPILNKYSLYVGESLTPLISWTDTTEIVNHGPGERYVGFGFKSDLLFAGVMVSDWIIADAV